MTYTVMEATMKNKKSQKLLSLNEVTVNKLKFLSDYNCITQSQVIEILIKKAKKELVKY